VGTSICRYMQVARRREALEVKEGSGVRSRIIYHGPTVYELSVGLVQWGLVEISSA